MQCSDAVVPSGGGMVDCIIIQMSASTTLKDTLLYCLDLIVLLTFLLIDDMMQLRLIFSDKR